MMGNLHGIATGTPTWVWPLLLTLTGIGVLSMRERVSPVWVYYMIPFMAIFALRAVAGLHVTPELWGLFAASYAVGTVTGWRLQPRWIIGRQGMRVALRGEPLTLVTILTVFVANFVAGTMQAVAPHMAAGLAFQAGFVALVALASGLFLGRTLAIAKARRSGIPARA